MRLMVSCRLKVCSCTHKWNAARQPTFSLRWRLPVSLFLPPPPQRRSFATLLIGTSSPLDPLSEKNSGGDHLLISCLFVHASCFLCPKDSARYWGDYFIMSVLQVLTKRWKEKKRKMHGQTRRCPLETLFAFRRYGRGRRPHAPDVPQQRSAPAN